MSTTTFKNIALLGATGMLGSKITTALTGAGFKVTAIQRHNSPNKVPAPTKSIKLNLASREELITAFKGQDVVVSALPNPRLETEKPWIEAAISAGISRIVLSEFSTNLETQPSRQLPIVKDKLEIRRYVEELASAGKVTWTSINNGPFFVNFVWGGGWMGPNFKEKFATYHDGGNTIVATSTLEQIAEGVAKVLLPEHAADSRNKSVYVYSAPMSERRMTEIAAKAAGIDVSDYKVNDVKLSDLVKETQAAMEKGDMSKMMNWYVPFCFGEGYGGDFRDIAWNEKLGLKELNEEDIERKVKEWL